MLCTQWCTEFLDKRKSDTSGAADRQIVGIGREPWGGRSARTHDRIAGACLRWSILIGSQDRILKNDDDIVDQVGLQAKLVGRNRVLQRRSDLDVFVNDRY